MAEIAEQKWVLINKNEPLNTNDRVRMYYGIIGPTYMMAAQIAAIEKKLEADPRFTLTATSLPKNDGWVKDIWFEILVSKPKQQTPTMQQAGINGAVLAVIISSAFVLSSVFCWLSFKEIRKMDIGPAVAEVVKETGWTAMKIGAAAVVGVIAVNMWKR